MGSRATEGKSVPTLSDATDGSAAVRPSPSPVAGRPSNGLDCMPWCPFSLLAWGDLAQRLLCHLVAIALDLTHHVLDARGIAALIECGLAQGLEPCGDGLELLHGVEGRVGLRVALHALLDRLSCRLIDAMSLVAELDGFGVERIGQPRAEATDLGHLLGLLPHVLEDQQVVFLDGVPALEQGMGAEDGPGLHPAPIADAHALGA